MKVLRKSCTRCQGDLSLVDDIGDRYYSCVQCGHIVYAVAARRPLSLNEFGSEPQSEPEVARRAA